MINILLKPIQIAFVILLLSSNALAQGVCSCGGPEEDALVNTYEMAITCSVLTSPAGVIALIDSDALSYGTAIQTTSKFERPDWGIENLGNIFFTEFDAKGNIYAAASQWGKTSFQSSVVQYGSLGGSGAVYKLDAITGAPTVFATLPQEGNLDPNDDSGLAGITYDISTESFYVVNWFDDTIYQLDACTGDVLDTFAVDLPEVSGTDDNSFEDFTFQNRPFGLDINPVDGRLYFSVHDGTNNGTLSVESVGLDPNTGVFINDQTTEVSLAVPPPVATADIDFNDSGQMGVSMFTATSDDFLASSYYVNQTDAGTDNHQAGVHIFEEVAGVWTDIIRTNVTGALNQDGDSDGRTASGGFSWNHGQVNSDIVWMNGHNMPGGSLEENGGIVGYDVNLLDQTSAEFNMADFFSPIIEDNPNFISFLYSNNTSDIGVDIKGISGDIDIFDNRIGCELVTIGDYVWSDTNLDGEQNESTPLAGVTVNLYDASGVFLQTTTTDANGLYSFEVLADTDFSVKLDDPANFAAGGLLEGATLTTADAGSTDANDSDAILMDGFPSIMLTSPSMGEDLSFDFGLITEPVIGDTIFFDEDKDGVQDAGEFVIGGVTVNLYDAVGALIVTTVTDSNGNYFFAPPAGTAVTIKLDHAADYLAGGPLEGLIPTTQDSGADDALDSDAADMGGFPAIMATSPTIENDFSFDFGFIGESDFFHSGARERLIDNSSLVLSLLNERVSRQMLRSADACPYMSRKKLRKINRNSENLYTQVWQDIWVNTRNRFSDNCVEGYDNTESKESILASIKKLNKMNAKMASCLKDNGKVKKAKKIRRKFKRTQLELKQALETVPDTVSCN